MTPHPAPLPLPELGINWNAILETTKEVVNPTRPVREEVLQSADLAGPLVFGLLLGVLLLFVRGHAPAACHYYQCGGSELAHCPVHLPRGVLCDALSSVRPQ